MARKVGQIIARGDRRWLIRVYLGRDHETKKRNYHNRTIHGSMREAQAYLTRKLRERDLGRDLEGAKITLNEYLDRWLETAVRPRVRPKTFQDYQVFPDSRQHTSHVRDTTAESWDRTSMFLSGRSRQQSYANLTSIEVYVSVSSTLKHQRCRNPCFWKFVSLHPICKIEVHLWPECFLAIREYASYYRLPLWRTVVRFETELNSFPNFRTSIDGLGIHFIHVRSPHPDALPIILTHGWPGSIVEFIKIIRPLTNPTEHGGRAQDAFHVVVPSLPGFGFSDK